MKAVIFARGYNITGQVEKCKEYAEQRGLNVAGVIVGQGSELSAVIGGLDEDIKIVIVYDMARISRNPMESYTILAELELDYGVTVEVATSEQRSEVEERLMKNIIKSLYENDIRERIRLRAKMRLNR